MNLVCDLDGVVYRGHTVLPGSAEALRRAQDVGIALWFATNNSTRTPEQVHDKLRDVAGADIPLHNIVTSPQSAASLLTAEDHPAFVLGSEAIGRALVAEGISLTRDAAEAGSVVVGMDFDLNYERLAAACGAVSRGARFVATNTDPTYPVDGGLLPGSGALVAAVATASGRQPEVAGKPNEAMRALLRRRGVDSAWVVGDRLDTDVALAANEDGWKSILVLTGVTDGDEDTSAADHVVADLAAAVNLLLGHIAEG